MDQDQFFHKEPPFSKLRVRSFQLGEIGPILKIGPIYRLLFWVR